MATGNDWRGGVRVEWSRVEEEVRVITKHALQTTLRALTWISIPPFCSRPSWFGLFGLHPHPVFPQDHYCGFFLISPYAQSYTKTLCMPETPHSSGLNNSVNHRSIPLLPEPHSWPTQSDSHTATGLINLVTLFPFTFLPSHINTKLWDESQHSFQSVNSFFFLFY